MKRLGLACVLGDDSRILLFRGSETFLRKTLPEPTWEINNHSEDGEPLNLKVIDFKRLIF